MIEPDELRAELARAATVGEPPSTLDTDRVVAGGKALRRRRQVLLAGGGVLAAALVIGVPAVVFAGPGIGLSRQQAGAGGSTIEPTPGAPHGGCRGQTRSGSTDALALSNWLRANMPDGRQFGTMAGWQVADRTDCVDGGHLDSNQADFRRKDRAGDLIVTTVRNTPAERVTPPCQPPDVIVATKEGVPSATGIPTGEPTATRPVAPTGSGTRTNADGSRFTRCETRTLADGSTLTIEELHNTTYPDNPSFVSLTVALWRTDGTVVRVDGDNRVVPGSGHPTTQPPLTAGQLIALAQNRGLQTFIPPAR
ncbi:MAG: hypothetical protein V7637_404 [Mycobacteriales bacterium]|jgi:hypothetical protein